MTEGKKRFQISKPPLGSGAFGLVYKAYDRDLMRPVAIKIPHDEEKERALRKEAQLMARILDLNEPHVVKLYDLHEIDGQRVIVMEYVEGVSLRDLLGKIGKQHPLELNEALDIAVQACLGLRTLHNAFSDEDKSAGIFHRDVKPENILIKRGGGRTGNLVKIADFGIAKVLASTGFASTTIGTVPYMAPESLQGEGADYRADIYGLGVTLYEMLTGRLPFDPIDSSGQPKGPLVYCKEICRGNPPPPSSVAQVDNELNDIVLKAMHCAVDERFQSIDDLLTALTDYQSKVLSGQAIAEAWREQEPTKCESSLSDIVSRYPRNPDGYRNLAWFYNRHLRFVDALRILEEGRALCPNYGPLLFDLAQVYHKVGDVDRAVKALELARREELTAEMQQKAAALLKIWRHSPR